MRINLKLGRPSQHSSCAATSFFTSQSIMMIRATTRTHLRIVVEDQFESRRNIGLGSTRGRRPRCANAILGTLRTGLQSIGRTRRGAHDHGGGGGRLHKGTSRRGGRGYTVCLGRGGTSQDAENKLRDLHGDWWGIR